MWDVTASFTFTRYSPAAASLNWTSRRCRIHPILTCYGGTQFDRLISHLLRNDNQLVWSSNSRWNVWPCSMGLAGPVNEM